MLTKSSRLSGTRPSRSNSAQRDLQSKVLWGTIYLPLKLANAVYSISTGASSRPVFLSIKETYPQLLELEQNFAVIKSELESILPGRNQMATYHELDPMQAPISAGGNPNAHWRVFLLNAMGLKPETNCQKCPQTTALLDRIPGVVQAFFSILDGGKSVPAHEGPYRGYLRYHLALIVPEDKPPRMRIKDQWVTWEEGKAFLFDDTWNHEVINESQQIRVVLVVDLLRPLRPIADVVNRVVFRILKSTYAKRMVAKV
jgi:aspartyl/asparaginyl beta-hydroxylase (cupin superfamily)